MTNRLIGSHLQSIQQSIFSLNLCSTTVVAESMKKQGVNQCFHLHAWAPATCGSTRMRWRKNTMITDAMSLCMTKSSGGMILIICMLLIGHLSDIGKSTCPRSSTGENSGGPMKTIVVPVLLSGKKNSVGSPSIGPLMLKKKMRSCESFGGPVKLGFSMWSSVLRSVKGPKVFPMSDLYLSFLTKYV